MHEILERCTRVRTAKLNYIHYFQLTDSSSQWRRSQSVMRQSSQTLSRTQSRSNKLMMYALLLSLNLREYLKYQAQNKISKNVQLLVVIYFPIHPSFIEIEVFLRPPNHRFVPFIKILLSNNIPILPNRSHTSFLTNTCNISRTDLIRPAHILLKIDILSEVHF